MTDQRPLTPQARLRRPLRGRPIRLGDATWILPYAIHSRVFDTIRDRMYESIAGRGTVATTDVLMCAYTLLTLSYDLSDEEVAQLIRPVDPKELMDHVLTCLMGAEEPLRSYSNWVRSSLQCNGLDPEKIPDEDLPLVLYQLEATGRICPLEKFSHIEMRKSRIANLLSNR